MMFRLWERATRRDSGPEVFQNFLTLLWQPVVHETFSNRAKVF